jgi:hypothetical protein
MKCSVCPFSLVCYANRFVLSYEKGRTVVYLCPLCGKLIIIPGGPLSNKIRYTFCCEKRKLTRKIKEAWYDGTRCTRSSEGLYVLRCNICKDIQGQIRYIDLDKHDI